MESGFGMINNGGYLRWYTEARQLHPYVQQEGETIIYGGFGPRLTYYDAHRCRECQVFTIVMSSTVAHSDEPKEGEVTK